MKRRAVNALRTAVILAALAVGAGSFGVLVGRHFEYNMRCCQVPRYRNLALSFEEPLGLVHFYAQIGQDRWVAETMFPAVRNGFFLDVGSGDGTIDSNTKLLEERGWTGICVDPFPTHMENRTCQMFKEVVSDQAGLHVKFRQAGELGGVAGTLGRWKDRADLSPLVDFTTVTLGDILARGKAPAVIQFISLDIEGAELDALRGFPFDRYSFRAMAVEHNDEEPKRSGILALLASHGYQRVRTWYQDDFYVPVT